MKNTIYENKIHSEISDLSFISLWGSISSNNFHFSFPLLVFSSNFFPEIFQSLILSRSRLSSRYLYFIAIQG